MSSYSANLSSVSILLCYALSLNADTLPETIEKVIPSVVKIKVQRSEFQNEENELISVDSGGSGFILDKENHIVTNAHVIGEAKKIIIADVNNNEYSANLIGKDDKTDIAVIEAKAFSAPALDEDPTGQLVTGEKVFAIGSPYSLGHTTSYGIISALNRVLPNFPYVTFIQTDAAINPGNSGGPLFNENGKLIGMNSTYYSKQGNFTNIGFAIPIKDVHRIASKLIEDKKVQRGYIGAELCITERYVRKMGYQNGVLVTKVTENGPSEKAGILPGDIIIKIADHELKDAGEIHRVIEKSNPGDILKMNVLRNKAILEVHIQTDKPVMETKETSNAGTNDASEKLGIILSEKKNVVEIVTTYGVAKTIGLKNKDKVIEVNGNTIKSINEINGQLAKLKDLELAIMTIERENKRFNLPIGSKTALKAYSNTN